LCQARPNFFINQVIKAIDPMMNKVSQRMPRKPEAMLAPEKMVISMPAPQLMVQIQNHLSIGSLKPFKL
jgi:hypothetical protein